MSRNRFPRVALALIASLILTACGSATVAKPNPSPADPKPAAPVSLKVAYSSDASTLDPLLTSDTVTEVINKNIYNNLVRFDTEMEIVGDLAEKWSVSEDRKVWTFTLRKGVTFHDGTPFDAESVKFNFERVLNKENASPRRSVLAPITRVEVSGPLEVKLHTEAPVGALLQYLSHPVGSIVSPAAVAKYGKELGRNPVGTGPFIFEQWVTNDKIVLKKNPTYFEGDVKIDTLEFAIVPEAATRALLVESGQVDAAVALPPDNLARFAANKELAIQKVETVKTNYIALNASRGGALGNPKVRRALNHAIDKNAIVKNILSDLGRVADSPISNKTFGYAKTGVYEYDLAKAKQLLTEAGYPNGFEFELWSPDGRYLGDRQTSEYVQAEFAKIGVTMKVRTWEFQAMLTEIKKGEFDAVFLAWSPSTGDADHAMYPVFHSSQHPPKGSNRAFLVNAEVDRLLEAARVETDSAKRKQIYAQAQKEVFDAAAWLFLVNPMELLVTRSNVTGVESLATEHLLFARAQKK